MPQNKCAALRKDRRLRLIAGVIPGHRTLRKRQQRKLRKTMREDLKVELEVQAQVLAVEPTPPPASPPRYVPLGVWCEDNGVTVNAARKRLRKDTFKGSAVKLNGAWHVLVGS